MNKSVFMKELEVLLSDLPQTEKEEALQYYVDYFEDAGVDQEEEVILMLGTPAQVAETIRRDIRGEEIRTSASPEDCVLARQNQFGEEQEEARENTSVGEQKRSVQGGSNGERILLILLLILASPIWIPLLLGALGLLFGVMMCWVAIISGIYLAAIVMILMLPFLLVIAVMCVPESLAVATAVLGLGLLCAAIGVLLLVPATAMAWGLGLFFKWSVGRVKGKKNF